MNNLLKFLTVILILLFVGCSSSGPAIFNSIKSTHAKERKAVIASSERNLAADSIWIVKQDGLQGEAGLFENGDAKNISSLSISVDLKEFLASVDVSINYEQLNPSKKLTFKYPAFKGMLVRDFMVSIGQRKFRAIISEKESAEQIFNFAKNRGHNAFLVSQKAFSDMLVDISLKQNESLAVDFVYSQLTSVSNGKRVLTLPKFKGLLYTKTEIEIKGEFATALTSFSGLNKKVTGRKIYESISDLKLLQRGLEIFYSTESMKPLSSDGKKAIIWDSKNQNFLTVKLGEKADWVKIKTEELNFVYNFLELQEMVNKAEPFKEIQKFALNSKMLTPFTKLLLVDSQK